MSEWLKQTLWSLQFIEIAVVCFDEIPVRSKFPPHDSPGVEYTMLAPLE